MKKFRRIISMVMVLVLFIGILPMNLGVVKAEAELDETNKIKDIRARVYDGDKWEEVRLTAVVYIEGKGHQEFITEFNSDIKNYKLYLDPKYEKIQFSIKKNSDEQELKAICNGDIYKIDANDNGDIVTIRPGTSVLSVTDKKNVNLQYIVSINKPGVGNIHKLSVTSGSAEFYEAYEGDLVTIWADKSIYSGKVFDRWVKVEDEDEDKIIELEQGNDIIKELNKTPTELRMPNYNLTVKPIFKDSEVSDSNLRNIILYGLEDEVWKNQKSKLVFNKEQKSYSVDLSDDYSKGYVYFQSGESIQTITATLNDKDIVLVEESNGYKTEKLELNDGENIFKIIVKSEDKQNTSKYTLIVNIEEAKYKVSFDPGEGKGTMNEEEFVKGSTYNLPECKFEAPENKEFKAWSVDGEEKAVGDVITINEDTEITATWRDKPIEKYKVTLVANNGTNDTKVVEIEKGKEYTLPDCPFTAPDGQMFKAWQIDEIEYNPKDKITIDAENIIKAIWQAKPNPDKPGEESQDKLNQKHAIKITPSPYGEVIIKPSEAKAGDKVNIKAIAHYGYELVGLSVCDASGELLPITNDQFIMPDGEVDIYPIFREIAPYIEPETDDKDEREEQKRRARRNYYNEEEKDEDEVKTIDKAKEEKQKESKVLISIGDKKLDKINNGVRTVLNMDVKPYIKGGRTMLPLRYVAEALGYRVAWLSETRTAVIMDIGLRVEIPVDSNFIIVNGVKYTSDVKPELRKNRIMLPIANIARALGLKDGKDIIWDEVNRQVTLIRNFNTK